MKKVNQVLCTALVFFLIIGLSACGSNGTTGKTTVQTSSQGTVEQTSTGTDKTASGAKLPLTKEKVTFTYWTAALDAFSKNGMLSLNDSLSIKELEKRTNIHIEFQHPAIGTEKESFQLMVASKQYPDFISYNFKGADGYPGYIGGYDKAIDDGIIIRLNDLIEKNAPNYLALINSDPEINKQVRTDNGNIPAFFSVNVPNQGPWWGPVVRKDWLDELNMELPVTIDDWTQMLRAFKEKKGATAPFSLYYTGVDPFNSVIGAFGVAGGFYQVDGKAKYGPVEDGYKRYIQTMNSWYSEGLIDKDFTTRKDFFAPNDLTTTGKTGAWNVFYTMTGKGVYNSLSGDDKMLVYPVQYPVEKAGDTVHLRQFNYVVGNANTTITTACKEPDLAAKWLDYTFSDEGSILAMYGIEGESYEMVDGKPVLKDIITHNPDGLSLGDAMVKYASIPCKFYWQRELVSVTDIGKSAINDIWTKADGAYQMPPISMTSAEGTEFSNIMGDIYTLVQENTVKYIMGIEPMSSYDNFVKQIKDMKIDRAIAIQQVALDRYSKR